MAALIIFAFLIFCSGDPLSLISAVLCHEAGHVLAAWLIAKELPQISFSIAGMRLSYIGLSKPSEQTTVSAAGPFASILLGLMFFDSRSFSLFSLGLGIVNLLPAACLDGGGILRAATEKFFLPQVAYKLCRAVSIVTIMLVFILDCAVQLKYGTNMSLAIITVYLVYRTVG